MQRILIAVKSRALIDVLTQELSSQFEVHCCSDGLDASKLIEKLRPNALIIDLRLPGRNGLSVLEGCSYRPPAIIALTNYIDDDVMLRANAAGVALLVQTPCTTRCILGHLEHISFKTPCPDF